MVEALLFVSGDPLTVKDITKATEWDDEAVIASLHELQQRYAASDGGLQCTEVANGWQITTKPDYAPIVGKLLAPNANRLSKAALEVVTIIAYRQPCTSAEIEAIRGVSSDGVLKTLLERELVADVGRRQ
jgi:segregation and condensation protein B